MVMMMMMMMMMKWKTLLATEVVEGGGGSYKYENKQPIENLNRKHLYFHVSFFHFYSSPFITTLKFFRFLNTGTAAHDIQAETEEVNDSKQKSKT